VLAFHLNRLPTLPTFASGWRPGWVFIKTDSCCWCCRCCWCCWCCCCRGSSCCCGVKGGGLSSWVLLQLANGIIFVWQVKATRHRDYCDDGRKSKSSSKLSEHTSRRAQVRVCRPLEHPLDPPLETPLKDPPSPMCFSHSDAGLTSLSRRQPKN